MATKQATKHPMMSKWQRLFWRIVAIVIPEAWLKKIFKRMAPDLVAFMKTNLTDNLTDAFVELLLHGMDVAFVLFRSYRRNLRGFEGSYVLRTADGRVAASMGFAKGRMWIEREAVSSPSVTVAFTDAGALRRFLFSKDQDILSSLLANEVEVDANVTYVYKLGFLARDLAGRLGVA